MVHRLFCSIAFAACLPLGAGAPAASLSAQAAAWDRPNYTVRSLLRRYYGRGVTAPSMNVVECSGDWGEVCFGGDPEDQSCSRMPGCRSLREQTELLERLRTTVEGRPEDAFAVGQAVYTFLRLGHPDEARQLVETCATVEWWCMLLRGLVLYRTGHPGAAADQFDQALDHAAPDLACRLRDIGPLLSGSDRSRYKAQPCGSRDSLETWFWWLADPMFSRTGNDRYTEHIARRFQAVLHEQVDEARGRHHPDTHETQLVRWGPEDSWIGQPFHAFTSRQAARYHFVPEGELFASVGALEYHLETNDAEGFTPVYGRFVFLPSQFVRFRDGDSMVVAAATDLTGTSTKTWFNATSVLVLSDGPDQFRMVSGTNPRDATIVFATRVNATPHVGSLEVTGTSGAIGHRRQGLSAVSTQGFGVSDVLLYAPVSGMPPRTRRLAIVQMLGTTDIEVGTNVGVYWEVYGTAPGEAVTRRVEIRVARAGVAARVLGWRVRTESPSAVSWVESSSGRVDSGVFDLDISSLEPGTYTIRLILTTERGERAESEREFRVVSP